MNAADADADADEILKMIKMKMKINSMNWNDSFTLWAMSYHNIHLKVWSVKISSTFDYKIGIKPLMNYKFVLHFSQYRIQNGNGNENENGIGILNFEFGRDDSLSIFINFNGLRGDYDAHFVLPLVTQYLECSLTACLLCIDTNERWYFQMFSVFSIERRIIELY